LSVILSAPQRGEEEGDLITGSSREVVVLYCYYFYYYSIAA